MNSIFVKQQQKITKCNLKKKDPIHNNSERCDISANNANKSLIRPVWKSCKPVNKYNSEHRDRSTHIQTLDI